MGRGEYLNILSKVGCLGSVNRVGGSGLMSVTLRGPVIFRGSGLGSK